MNSESCRDPSEECSPFSGRTERGEHARSGCQPPIRAVDSGTRKNPLTDDNVERIVTAAIMVPAARRRRPGGIRVIDRESIVALFSVRSSRPVDDRLTRAQRWRAREPRRPEVPDRFAIVRGARARAASERHRTDRRTCPIVSYLPLETYRAISRHKSPLRALSSRAVRFLASLSFFRVSLLRAWHRSSSRFPANICFASSISSLCISLSFSFFFALSASRSLGRAPGEVCSRASARRSRIPPSSPRVCTHERDL